MREYACQRLIRARIERGVKRLKAAKKRPKKPTPVELVRKFLWKKGIYRKKGARKRP